MLEADLVFKPVPPENCCRLKIYDIVLHPWFDHFISGCILLNMFFLCADY